MINPTHSAPEQPAATPPAIAGAETAGEPSRGAPARVAHRLNELGGRGFSQLAGRIETAADRLEGTRAGQGAPMRAALRPLHSVAAYLEEATPRSLATDTHRGILAHPYRALALGAGIAWLLGRRRR